MLVLTACEAHNRSPGPRSRVCLIRRLHRRPTIGVESRIPRVTVGINLTRQTHAIFLLIITISTLILVVTLTRRLKVFDRQTVESLLNSRDASLISESLWYVAACEHIFACEEKEPRYAADCSRWQFWYKQARAVPDGRLLGVGW